MANMGKTTKRVVAMRLDLHLCKAVERKYRLGSDRDQTTCFVRALEDATRNVPLTAQDYIEIAEEVRRNEMKRRSANKKGGAK